MGERPVVLALDQNRRNLELLAQFLDREGYELRGVSDLEELDRALEQPCQFSVALLDLTGFDERVWERAERLHEEGVPFLLISRRVGAKGLQEGLTRGAGGVLQKPLRIQELLILIRSLSEG